MNMYGQFEKLIRCGFCLAFIAASMLVSAQRVNAADQEHVNIAVSGFQICAERFPETNETANVFKNAGWRSYGILGDFRAYSNAKDRVIVATGVTNKARQGCFVAINKLKTNEGVALANALSGLMTDVRQVEPSQAGSVAEWTGKLKGVPMRLGVSKPQRYGKLRGASVLMIAE